MNRMTINDYVNIICKKPAFLEKYLNLSILNRLKDIGYFCGMDFASKDIYDFKYKISRYDHSVTTALLTYRYTNSIEQTIAALFHDISTPCFSHVIDYMNDDYELQESTEEKTEEILMKCYNLKSILKRDGLEFSDIVDFKKYSIVDNQRPKLCTDRLDGIILTSLAWTKELKFESVEEILDNVEVFKNEDNEDEIGFKDYKIAHKICDLNSIINCYCLSNEDNYMMELLSKITKYSIEKGYITYEDLYSFDENMLMIIFKGNALTDRILSDMLRKFETIKKYQIEEIELPNVKKRTLKPLVNGIRMK